MENPASHPENLYDGLSGEALKEMLWAALYSDGGPDCAAIDEILEKLEEVDPQPPTDIDESWETFKSCYLDAGLSPLLPSSHEIWTQPGEKASGKPGHRKSARRLMRVGLVAAVIVAILAATTITAGAFGYNLLGAVANWTREVFQFQSTQQTADSTLPSYVGKEVPKELEELELLMVENGADSSMLPGYIPEGYSLVDTQYADIPGLKSFNCLLEKGDNSLILEYSIYPDGQSGAIYQKDDVDPILYESGGIQFIILTNVDDYYAVWLSGNMECFIYGAETYEELIQILDSITEA